jgi:phage tail-like protein
MRRALSGLENPHPLGWALPGVFQEDAFLQQFTAGLDEVLAPVLCTLDNLGAYFDPALAPPDFVGWLAAWVGLALDEHWPPEQQRSLVAEASELHRWRGTVRGLAAHMSLFSGLEAEVTDSGATGWSETPTAPLPGTGERHVTVRIRAADPDAVDRDRLERIVAEAKPAHVSHEIEVVKR